MPTKQRQIQDSSMQSDSEEEGEDSDEAAWAAMNLSGMDDASRQMILDSIRASAASDEEEDEEQIRQMLAQPSAVEAATDPADIAAVEHEVAREALLGDTSADQSNGSVAQEALLEDANDEQPNDIAVKQALAIRLPPKKVDAESMKDYDQWDPDFWHHKEPEALDAALAAAQVWSRIIRNPRKRGKHIIIDVCSPSRHATNAEVVDTSHGHLVRQVVATNDKRTWLGAGGYRLARKTRWGDLWPKYYQDYALTQSTSD